MEFIGQHLIAPNGHYLRLLEILAVMVQLIHLPYIGVLVGSTMLAMWLTFSDHEIPNPPLARFAGELLDTFLGNRVAMLVFGVFPLLALPLIYSQLLYGADATPLKYLPLAIPGAIAGLVLLVLYRASFPARRSNFNTHMALGTLGVAVLLGSYFVLLSSLTRMNDPEKWFRVKSLAIMLLNWNVIWKFLFFVHAGLAITGAAVLFFFFRWRGNTYAAEPEYAAVVSRFGAGLGLAFVFALPVFQLLYVFTTPDVAFDNTVYLLAAALVAVAMLAAFVFVSTLRSPRPRFAARSFVLLLGVFLLSGVVDVRSMANANQERITLLTLEAEKRRAEHEAELEAMIAKGKGPGVGEDVFTNTCMQCHRFNERLVGPPLATVLPKYKDDPAALKTFISNPTKKNPDYPPMPNPGLTPSQVDAVADYVLERLAEGGQ